MNENHLALWAALTAFFGNLVALKVVDILGGRDAPDWGTFAAAVLTSLLVAGGVYAKQRLDDEKRARGE